MTVCMHSCRSLLEGGALLGVLALVMCLMLIVFSMAARSFALAIGEEATRPRIALASSTALLALAFAPFCLGFTSYIMLYLCTWIAALVAGLVANPSKRILLASNTAALCFMLSCSLFHFGYLSFVVPDEPASLFMRCLLVTAALSLATVFLLALAFAFKKAFPEPQRAGRALRPFSAFAYFAIVYELLDLTPTQGDLEFELLPSILLGSTLLVMLACGAFAFVAARLGAEALRESENRALERKRKDQETRLRLYLAQASTDELTHLATRRIGQEKLEQLQANRRPYALAFIDLDGLKRINDEQGHLCGDEYLVASASMLRSAFPESTIVRWGGDEFLIIDEKTDANQMEARLAALESAGRTSPNPVKFSFGVAASSPEAQDDALERADAAMYAVKREKHAAIGGVR